MPSSVFGSMRWALSAAVLVLGGCVCNDGLCLGTMAAPQSLFLTTAGSPVTVTVLNPTDCGVRTPTGVTVSVLDPANSTVEATASSPRVMNGEGFAADVTFTPLSAGQFHVVARFEPNFGSSEVDVLVAADRRDAGSVPSSGCVRGDFTPGGLALCYRTDGGTELLGAAQAFARPAARAGGTLWVGTGTLVQRWVEDGGAFERVDERSPTDVFTAVVPGVDDALWVTQTNEVRWLVDGGFRSTGFFSPAHDVMWKGGTNVVTVQPGMSETNLGHCIRSLVSDAGPRCSDVENVAIIGASPDGIAVEHTLTMGSEALLYDDTGPSGFRLPPGWHLGPLGRWAWDTVAVMGFDGGGVPDGGPYVLRRTPNGIILEDYGPDVRAVTSTCVTTGSRLIRR